MLEKSEAFEVFWLLETVGGVELRWKLGQLTENYVESRNELGAIIQLVDARRGPTELDMLMIEWLSKYQKPFLLVFTKTDKLSRNKLNSQLNRLEKEGGLAGISFAPFSAVKSSSAHIAEIWNSTPGMRIG